MVLGLPKNLNDYFLRSFNQVAAKLVYYQTMLETFLKCIALVSVFGTYQILIHHSGLPTWRASG